MKKLAAAITMFLLAPALGGAGERYPNQVSPIIETRMWCPEDIEEYAGELMLKEEDYWELQRHWAVSAGRSVDSALESISSHVPPWLSPFTSTFPSLGDFFPSSVNAHSVMMRNVAYHYLRTWPASRDKIAKLAVWSVGSSRQASYGKHLLRTVYGSWAMHKERLKRRVFDHNNRRWFEQQYNEWVKEWGTDPVDQSRRPGLQDDVPEEFDGKWYLSVMLDTGDLRYYACMVKTRHIFGTWDSTNTSAQSHFVSRDELMVAPYPVRMEFFLGSGSTNKSILFSDDVLNGMPWVELKPLPYRGPDGSSPHVAYEFEYPIFVYMDASRSAFFPAKAVLASAPGRDYRQVQAMLRQLKSKGVESIGEEFRAWGGEYERSED